jgi:hypothetical protein
MQAERTAEMAALSGSVRGAGVCDVLQVELQPVQRALLLERVETLRSSLEEELARQLRAAAPSDQRAAEALRLARYELRLVELLDARLPSCDVDAPFEFVGPADMVARLARECLAIAVKDVAQLVDADGMRGPRARARLITAANAAGAWVRTFVDCQAVEESSFDPSADPALRS